MDVAMMAIVTTIDHWIRPQNQQYQQEFHQQLTKIYHSKYCIYQCNQVLPLPLWHDAVQDGTLDNYKKLLRHYIELLVYENDVNTMGSTTSNPVVGTCTVCQRHIIRIYKIEDSVVSKCQSKTCGAFGFPCFFRLFL